MLTQARCPEGFLIESVGVNFEILPESNPIHVKDILKQLENDVAHINGNSVYSTFDTDLNMNYIRFTHVPENKLDEVKSILNDSLISLQSQNAIHKYHFKY